MSLSENSVRSSQDSGPGKVIWIVVVLVGALIVGAIFLFRSKTETAGPGQEDRLAGAIRPGSAEWTQYADKIVLDKPEADESKRALGDIVMGLHSTVRNFTTRTINGLEVHGAVVDLQGKPVRERTVIVIPNKQAELEANKTLPVNIMLEGMKDTDTRADIKMKITGFSLKP